MIEDMIRTRLKQLEDEVQTRSEHKNPMYYKALENYRWCSIVSDLLNDITPDIKEVEAVCGVKQARTTQPDSNIDLSKYIYDGANVMDVLNKYRDTVPDIHDRLKQAVKDAGFIIKGFCIRNK